MSTMIISGSTRCRVCDSADWNNKGCCVVCGAACCSDCPGAEIFTLARNSATKIVCGDCRPTWFHCHHCGSSKPTVDGDRKLTPGVVCCDHSIAHLATTLAQVLTDQEISIDAALVMEEADWGIAACRAGLAPPDAELRGLVIAVLQAQERGTIH